MWARGRIRFIEMKMRKNLPWIAGIGAVVAILMLLFSCDLGQLLAWTRPPAQTDPVKTRGNPNAAVTMIEVSDFQ